MSQNNLVLANLTSEMIPECIRIYSRSFISQNSLWQKLGISQKQAEEDMELKFKYAADTPTSFVKIFMIQVMIDPETKQIATITITIDVLDYIDYLKQTNKKYVQSDSEKGMLFLSKYGLEA